MRRLVDAVALAPIRNATQRCTRQHAQRPDHAPGLVRQHITKRVVRVDDAVEHPGVLAHQHGQRVGQLMLELDVRELVCKDLRRDFPPEASTG